MKWKTIILGLSLLLLLAPFGWAKKLFVVTSVPDLADIARQIGKERVEVVSLTTGVENLHHVPLKPSFLVTLRKADVLIVLGLEAEHAWLPALIEASRNKKIRYGAPGYVDASKYIIPIEIPEAIDPALGHVHPKGNPHYNLDPKAGPKMAKAIAEGLSLNDPTNAAYYQANLSAYLEFLREKWHEWKEKGEKLRGLRFISYHKTFGYFARRFGMIEVGTIQLATGVEPTPTHLKELLEKARRNGCEVVIREVYYPEKTPRRVARALGVPLVSLPVMVGGVPEVKTWPELIDYLIEGLSEIRDE
ncbi:metal ABC transporter substrate-binding protein [Thermosulfurimonas dismutans]|uniref:Zinc ABC transporter, periplasmic-binding protein ZnuA n=1 Tax=Thermosulfurimonas dismutans TaxID=999894 RepID=A0A179D2Y6_9BACT|nr:metal ABC transporter substrate-binding protein [Thermosulfurimonas dismutans]OAQ20079.1 Zinc ABC transporter, periplasmic-binding protein ZnuA [Thermosulfurimonas dismutans]